MADPPVIERDFRYHDLSSEALSQHFFAMPATRCGLKVVPWDHGPFYSKVMENVVKDTRLRSVEPSIVLELSETLLHRILADREKLLWVLMEVLE